MITKAIEKVRSVKKIRPLSKASGINQSNIWRLVNIGPSPQVKTLMALEEYGFFDDIVSEKEKLIREYISKLSFADIYVNPPLRKILEILDGR